jgi:A/G-specific adenine glycosylase
MMESETTRRFRNGLLQWGEDNHRDFPWRKRTDQYDVFVAEFFLTQTPAKNVATVYPDFLQTFPDLTAIRKSEIEHVTEVIEPLGFQNMRAEALAEIATDHDELPKSADELTNLPRVRRYVANATVCFAHDRPLPIVDRNVDRVYRRVFPTEWPRSESEQWDFAKKLVPEDRAREYNFALLDFGSTVCASEPNCESCFANEFCQYYRDEDTSEMF